MKEELYSLIDLLKKERAKYGNFTQKPADLDKIELLKQKVLNIYETELSAVYIYILQKINGFNENGIFLYGTQKSLIEGYSDRYIDGLIEANEMWHESEVFSSYLFYGDSDLYLFVKSIKTGVYTCRVRDDFESVVLETINDFEFFEKILKLTVDESFSLE